MNNEKSAKLYISIALFFTAFMLYLRSMAPTVTFGDSGELIAAITSLGISHPTGFPLYILLGKLFSLLPFANPALRINVMSAVFAAFVPVVIFHSLLLVPSAGSKKLFKYSAAFLTALLAVFSYTLWSQSGMARIYTLNALFCAAALYIFLLISERGASLKLYSIFAFLTGLGAGLHLTFTVTAGILWVFIIISDYKFFLKNLFWMIVFFLSGLSIYLYIIIRGGGNPLMQWSVITTPDDFYTYFTQQHYKKKMFSRDIIGYSAYFDYIRTVVFRELSPAGVLLMALGAVAGLAKRFRYALALILIFFANIVILSLYGNYTDLKLAFRYLIPSYMAGLFLVYMFFEYIAAKIKNLPVSIAATAIICAVIISLSFPVNHYETDKSGDYLAYFFTKDTLDTLPEHSYLFASGDNQIFPLAYFKYVLKQAPTVRILDNIPTVFKDAKQLYSDSQPTKLSSSIIKAFSMNYFPVFSTTPVGSKLFSEYPYGLLYFEADKKVIRMSSAWQTYSLKGILNDTSFFNDFEEREVVGTYLYRYANYYRSLGKAPIYSYLLQKSTDKAYDSMSVLTNVAILYTSDTSIEKNFTQAELLFRRAEKIDPDNTDFLFNFGSFYGIIGQYAQAAKYFDRVAKLDPMNISARMYFERATAQVQAEYDRQVKLGKEQIMHYEAGVQFFNNKKLTEATKEFLTDIKNNPDLPRSYFYMGLIYSISKEFDKAIPMYEKALKSDPDNVGTLNNIGLCHIRLKQYKQAAEYFRYSLQIKPGQDRIEKILKGIENKL
jgi:Tfp pilus assembly protein PilF